MVTRYCPDCHKPLPKGSRTRRRCKVCQAERTKIRRKELDGEKRARAVRDTEHMNGGKGCPFAGNCVDIHGLDRFLKAPRPAATHRSDASRDHRGPGSGQSLY